MADDSRPPGLRATPDPYGRPPQPDGDRVHREPEPPPPDLGPVPTWQKLIVLLWVVLVVAGVLIGELR